MKFVGFSTGAIAYGDFRGALRMVSNLVVNAVELSALRLSELRPLLDAIDKLDLSRFAYVSFHAPSNFSASDEPAIVESLMAVSERKWPIIVHPDSIHDSELWLPLQRSLYFENMDKRKPVGRTAGELETIFARFRESSLCFDLGHAYQIDRTMSEARLIAQRFRHRIKQLHVSEVDTRSRHVALTAASEFAFEKIVDLINDDIPVIIESVVTEHELQRELGVVAEVFDGAVRTTLERSWG